ncbi:unnamed protein product [Closterium sp. NIES-53]
MVSEQVCSLGPTERSALPGIFFFCPPAQHAALPTRALLPCPCAHIAALPVRPAALPGCRAALPARTSHPTAAHTSRPAARTSRSAAHALCPACAKRQRPSLRALAPYPACATCPTLPTPRPLPCLRHVPCPACATRPALPPRHAPCPACAMRQRPALRALAPCPACASALPAPAPYTVRSSAALHAAQRCLALPGCRQSCPARCPALTCPACSRCLRVPALPHAYRHLPLPPAHAPTVATATASTTAATTPTVPTTATAVATFHLAGSRVRRSLSRRSSFASGLSSGAAPVAELAVLVGGSRFRHSSIMSGHSGGVLLLEVPLRGVETLSPQQLREWAVRWGSPGGGGFRGTRTGGVEAPSGVEATSLCACDSASVEAEPEEALHTFILDSGVSRCFFRDSTTVTPLTVPVPVTLADPSGGPVVACGATVLPCPAAPSGLFTDVGITVVEVVVVSGVAARRLRHYTSGPIEGGDQTAADTVAPRRSALLAIPPGFPPRPSSLPLRPVAVDSGAAGGGDTRGADSGGAGSRGAASPTGAGGAGGAAVGGSACGGAGGAGAGAGGAGARRQETLLPKWLRKWAVRWGSPSGGAWSARAAGSEGAGLGDASAGVPGVGCAGVTGTGGTGATRGAAAVGAIAGSPGSHQQEPLSPERLHEWAVRRGSPGGGAGCTGAAGSGGASPGGASAGVPEGTGTGGTGAAGGTGGGGPVGASAPIGPHLLPGSPLPAPAPHTAVTESFTECREPASRPIMTFCSRRDVRPRPPPVPDTHIMALQSDLVSTASPTVTCLLTTVVTDPYFESVAVSALVVELVDFAALCRLDYATSLAFYSSCPPSVGGELALGCDVLEDMQFELECLAVAAPHLASTLLCPEGDPDALDILTPRTYAEAITGPYSSEWQIAMDAKMASRNSTGTYVNEVLPPWANIVDGMWIFRVKWPPGSPHAFKARYVVRGFRQREGVDFFHTFSPTPKMTTLRVLLHVAAQRDYELHSLDFSTAFLQGSLHEAILTTLAALGFAPSTADPLLFLRTSTSLPPFYVVVYVDDLVFATADTEALALVKAELQERHTCTNLGELRSYLGLQITWDRAYCTITLTQSHMMQQVLQRFDFSWSLPQPTPLSICHFLSAPPSNKSVEPSGPYPELVGCIMYLMTCTRPDFAYPLSLLARYVAPGRHRKVHWVAMKRVSRYLRSTSGMGLVLGGPGSVNLTGHSDASWANDQMTHRSTQGYSFSLGAGSVSLKSTRSSSVLSFSCEDEIYAGAMAP